MSKDFDPHEAVDFIYRTAPMYAQAKANRVYLEEFRKSKKALLMKGSGESAIGAQEREAYAHADYLQLLEGLREAVEKEIRQESGFIARASVSEMIGIRVPGVTRPNFSGLTSAIIRGTSRSMRWVELLESTA